MLGERRAKFCEERERVQTMRFCRIYHEPGGWGMAARSPHAFAVHALLRFNGVEYMVTANRSVSASMTPSHVLPVLALGSEEGENEEWDDVLLAGFPAIAKALVEKGWSLDAKLTKTQLAECLAFATTMDAILERARLFEWFLIEENFEVVHKVLAQDLSFPLSWIVPAMQRREARDRLRHMVVDEAGLWFDVRECLHALSVRLGDRKAFFLWGLAIFLGCSSLWLPGDNHSHASPSRSNSSHPSRVSQLGTVL
mmetsp:Transcript_18209/g.37976  ORF Transcript_18209/g.37976 Transcript_18209/m.37976 type:complete len:254 (+) Transcript_18209:1333-2094(+)